MPVAGLVRTRAHQFGRQSALGTAVAAKRRIPYSGVPAPDLQWTDPDVDAGFIYRQAAPVRGAGSFPADLTLNALYYNDLPHLIAGFFGGGKTPTGTTAKTWGPWNPAEDGSDAFDLFTYQFGNTDVTTDWYQFRDGYLQQLTINSPETGAGQLSATAGWRFGGAASTGSTDSPVTGTVPTTGLNVDTEGVPVYLKDCSLFIDSVAGSIGSTQISDSLHNFTLTLTQEVDEKRFANGTQSFDVDDFSRGAVEIALSCQFAKTSDTVGTGSESDAWFSDTTVSRFVRLYFESLAVAEAGSPDVPYSWELLLPMRYYTRTEGAIGGNATVILEGHAFVDPTLGYPFNTTVVNTLASTGI